MTINIFVQLNGENRSGAFLFLSGIYLESENFGNARFAVLIQHKSDFLASRLISDNKYYKMQSLFRLENGFRFATERAIVLKPLFSTLIKRSSSANSY